MVSKLSAARRLAGVSTAFQGTLRLSQAFSTSGAAPTSAPLQIRSWDQTASELRVPFATSRLQPTNRKADGRLAIATRATISSPDRQTTFWCSASSKFIKVKTDRLSKSPFVPHRCPQPRCVLIDVFNVVRSPNKSGG